MTEVDSAIKKGLRVYLCEREPPDKLLVFSVTTRAQSKANRAHQSPPEEPPTKAPPSEPPPAPNTLHMQPQAPAPDNGEIGLPDMEDDLLDQPIKLTRRPCTMKPSDIIWMARC